MFYGFILFLIAFVEPKKSLDIGSSRRTIVLEKFEHIHSPRMIQWGNIRFLFFFCFGSGIKIFGMCRMFFNPFHRVKLFIDIYIQLFIKRLDDQTFCSMKEILFDPIGITRNIILIFETNGMTTIDLSLT